MYGLRRGQIGLAKLGIGGSYEEPSMPDWFYGHAIVEKKELRIPNWHMESQHGQTHSAGICNPNMMMCLQPLYIHHVLVLNWIVLSCHGAS